MKQIFVVIFFLFSSVYLFAQNDPPIIINNVDTVDFNTTLNVAANLGLLANDSDPDGDPLTVITFIVNGTTFNAGQTANIATGALTINADGSYTFVPTAGYAGVVPDIIYAVSDGTATTSGLFQLTVEVPVTDDLLSGLTISSCNQGYTADGLYMIRYNVSFSNRSIALDDHVNSLITNVQITNNIDNIFGDNCVTLIERGGLGSSTNVNGISTTNPPNFAGNTYPGDFTFIDWDTDEFSETDATPGAENILLPSSNTHILYPRQGISYDYCIYIDPTCAGSPVDFDNIVTVTSSRGNLTQNLEITDFHTSETTVAANIFVVDDNPLSTTDNQAIDNIMEPNIQPDGTYLYTNNVIITNDGTSIANDVNFNMGLSNFIANGIVFQNITITQASGPPMNINPLYNGNTETLLLLNGNNLNPGETVVLDINFLVGQTPSSDNRYYYSQLSPSMTQGPADGFDETINQRSRVYSYVVWSDNQGNHLDSYGLGDDNVTDASSISQCNCDPYGLRYLYDFSLEVTKNISQIINPANNVLEHHATTFVLRATNTSSFVQVENIQMIDDLNAICGGNIISVTNPTIINSNATTNPNLNVGFNGTTDISIFDGNSGVLEPNQFVEVEFTVVFDEDCIGVNTTSLSAVDPLNNPNVDPIQASANLNVFTDTDGDGITNANDIDDDNDTIPDILENNGLNPVLDTDGDDIPNYLDTDAPGFIDNDGNGINDNYDFDGDGILNHLDLDSDNDGIFDIVEAGNEVLDTNNNGRTNSIVGANGLDDTVETDDTFAAAINYVLPNNDTDTLFDFIDIDSDNDGIVDIIEAQTTNNYQDPANAVDANGIDTNFLNGINPTDTDGDNQPDYIDLNSDDDYNDDNIEGWDTNNDNIADTTFANNDSDNDGLVDNYDNDDNSVNPTNSQVPTDFPNLDETTTVELDWREPLVITIDITDAEDFEGNTLEFFVTIDNPSRFPIVIDLVTQDNNPLTDSSAVSPHDYVPQTITITIPPDTIGNVPLLDVLSLEDDIYELDETFFLNGTITSANVGIVNTTISGIGTIRDNDNPPFITVNDAIGQELIDDNLEFLVELSHPSYQEIIITFTPSDITAIIGADYQGGAINVTFPATIIQPPVLPLTDFALIPILDDDIYEPGETMQLTGIVVTGITDDVNNDLEGIGTILDNEPLPTVTINSPEVVEGNVLVFTVSLYPISFETINLNIFTNNVTAQQGLDYNSLITQVSFAPFTNSLTVEVETLQDILNEETEFLTLTGIVTTFNTDNIQATNQGAILDDDIPNLFSPNGDGQSDSFAIAGLEDFSNFTIQIFDRWGSEVYNYSNNGNPTPIWWNGTYNGNPVPEGVYYYILDFNDGITKTKTGFIELIR